jgi:predicted RNA-binding Zn ribbon-like protein
MEPKIKMESKYNTKTGWLCLDFTNTVDWHASANPGETITEYADLIDWSKQVGIVSAGEADILSNIGKKKPAESQAVLNKAKVIREAIYNILSNISHGLGVKTYDLTVINKAVADMFFHSKLIPKDNSFAWDWDSKRERLDFILWPIVRSAAELMTSEALERVGQCADEQGCGWLFWDYSRNKSRRWCDIRDCGNRAKARRHYKKMKSEAK